MKRKRKFINEDKVLNEYFELDTREVHFYTTEKSILNKAIESKIIFFFTSSRSYTLPNSDIKVGTLKAYPMSIFLIKEEVDRIIDELNKEINYYADKNEITTGTDYLQDMSKDSDKDK